MKIRLLGLLVVAAPMVLATPSCVTTTIDGLVLDVKGQLYNYNIGEEIVEFKISDTYSCSWANNVTASNFSFPNEFEGKEITKINRVSDKVINVTFAKSCKSFDAGGTINVSVKPGAFKNAKVNNAFGSLIVNKSGMSYMERDYEVTDGLKYTGEMKGCKSFDGSGTRSIAINIADGKCTEYSEISVANIISCDLWIGSSADNNNFGFAIYDVVSSATVGAECSITIPYSVYHKAKITSIAENIDKKLKLSFVKTNTSIRPSDFLFGSQYFIA